MKYIQYWLVTIRKHRVKEYVSEDQLAEVRNYLRTKSGLTIRDYCNEAHGTYKQLHSHLLIETPINFRFIGCTKYKDFRIHWKIIKRTLPKVADYIHKRCKNHSEDQLEHNRLANYFRYHYAF